MSDELAAQIEILNRFPEVRWDRTAGTEDLRTVFGWVDRPGSIRSDFLVLIFHPDGDVQLVTSSAGWSEDFTRRLFGDVGEHAPCVPVPEVYGDSVRAVARRNLDPAVVSSQP